MDFITTPAETVTLDNNSIAQAVTVDMDKRTAPPVVHLTQYDKELSVIAVSAQTHGEAYAFPAGAAVNIRMGGKVYAPVFGLSEDRQTAYVAVTEEMTEAAGESAAVLEVVLNGGVAASAPITFRVDKSPAENRSFISTPAVIAAPASTSIIQAVSVYMDRRQDVPVVHLTQYDQTLPVVAVNAWYGDQPYTFPAGAAVNVRMAKPDRKNVYDPALGISSDRLTAYVVITAQMTAAYGKGRATLEVVLNGGVAGTAPIEFFIDKNPVPTDAYESSDEYKSLYDLIKDAEAAKSAAEISAQAAKSSETEADLYKTAAGNSATEAAKSANAAKKDRDEAKEYAKDAADVALHPPKIQDGHWWTWDTEANDYTDSGVDAGVSLTVGTVTTGEPGSEAKVTNRGTPTDPILDFTIPRGDVGPVSSVNGGTGDVVIGGRNIVNSRGEIIKYGSMTEIKPDNGITAIFRYDGVYKGDHAFRIPLHETLVVGETYMLSFDCSGLLDSSELKFSILTNIGYVRYTVHNGHNVYRFQIQTASALNYLMFDDVNPAEPLAAQTVTLCRFKIERGNVATDWSPAPEDKQDVPLAFSVSLPVANWANNQQTVTDARFLDGDQYVYDVNVNGLCVPWDGVSITEGQMTVTVDIVPTGAVTVDVVREEVQNG